MDLKKELYDIKELLKLNPRGMTVTDISKEIKMNRHSVAKYLDMLVIAGHVDMKMFGASKVFYPSRRLPMSAILNFSSDFIIVLDEDLSIVDVNDRFLEFEHIEKGDIVNRGVINSSFPMSFNPSIIPHIKEAVKGVESEIEASLTKQGDRHYFSIKFIPTVFDDLAQGVTIIFEDITARKKAENALKESEERFRSIFENAAIGIAYLANDSRFVRQNRRFSEILGYPLEDLMKMSYPDITHQDDRKESMDNIALLYSGKMNYFSMEKRYLRADGNIVWGHVTCALIRDHSGSVEHIVVVIEDITARKAMEEALRRARDELEVRVNERTLELRKANDSLMAEIAHSKRMESEARRALGFSREILEKAPFGIYIMNPAGRVDYVNPAMLKLTGIGERAFKEIDLLELPTYVRLGLDKLLRSALAGRDFFLGPVEYTSHFGNKTSIRNFIGMPMEEQGAKKVLVFIEDFSKYQMPAEALLNNQ